MSSENFPPKRMTEIIDELMEIKDPAVVGLRRILKNKRKSGDSFPLQSHTLEEFGDSNHAQKVFTAEEKKVIELERDVIKLKEEILRIKQDAIFKAEDSYKKGLSDGVDKGRDDGYKKAEIEFNNKIEDIESGVAVIIKDVEKSKNSLLKKSHKIILELAFEISKKIVNSELTINPNIVLSIIKKTVSHIAGKEGFIVRVSPEDISTVVSHKDLWTNISHRLGDIHVEEDSRISKGGCIIESGSGAADASIDVQFSEMKEILQTTWESVMATEVQTNEMMWAESLDDSNLDIDQELSILEDQIHTVDVKNDSTDNQ